MTSRQDQRMLDRLGPIQRPQRPVRGYQRWQSLLFLHWPVSVEAIRPLVPASLELDLYEGQAFVGVVPFVMQGVRPRWWPAALAFSFLETNVRTYVYHGEQPGVYFLSLDAASRLAVWAARRFWGLPYFHASMQIDRQGNEIRYWTQRSRTGATHQVHYRIREPLGPSLPETAEFFFLERYLLFVERHGRIQVGQVHHVPYPAQRVELLDVQDQLIAATGLQARCDDPVFAHYASGVDVEIYGLQYV